MDQGFNLNEKTQTEVLDLLNYYQLALEGEKKYHDTLDHLLEGFQIIDFNWRYQYVNNAVVDQSKFSREELLGHTMMEKYPGIEQTELFKTLRLCMEARVPSVFENHFNYPDGSDGWFQLSIQPTEGGLTILSNDISTRKKAEKAQAEQLKGLERIIFMTSHNVRQPITHLAGLVNLLENSDLSEEEFRKTLGYLKESVQALDEYTQDITGYMHAMEIKARK